MKAKKIQAYECPQCGQLHQEEEDAKECCGQPEQIDAWQCQECEEIHLDKQDATDCCK